MADLRRWAERNLMNAHDENTKSIEDLMKEFRPFFESRRSRTKPAKLLDQAHHVLSTGEARLASVGDPVHIYWPKEEPGIWSTQLSRACLLEIDGHLLGIQNLGLCRDYSPSLHFHFDLKK